MSHKKTRAKRVAGHTTPEPLDQQRISRLLGSTFAALGGRTPMAAYLAGKAKAAKKAKRKQ